LEIPQIFIRWHYEKLLITGDFLSNRDGVQADYNSSHTTESVNGYIACWHFVLYYSPFIRFISLSKSDS